MISKIVRWILTISGGLFFGGIYIYLNSFLFWFDQMEFAFLLVLFGVVFLSGLITYFSAPPICRSGRELIARIENEFSKIPTRDLIFGGIGLLLGLMLAYFASQLLMNLPIPILGTILSVIVTLFLGYLGARIGRSRGEAMGSFQLPINKGDAKRKPAESSISPMKERSMPKVLDTSVIIDGRIVDICKTQFLEGPLIVPDFVLEELNKVANSDDPLKANRGKRGLDVLKKLKEFDFMNVELLDHQFTNEYEKDLEVDVKLLKVALQLNGKVITNDYNLNKVAEVQGVDVLNINDLANAVKVVVIPGEDLHVKVIKAGKEKRQGLAYLEDGTMIVVEDGQSLIGKSIETTVTSVLQTSAGKMIFAKPKE